MALLQVCDLALLTVDDPLFWEEEMMSLSFVEVAPSLQVHRRAGAAQQLAAGAGGARRNWLGMWCMGRSVVGV